MAALVAYHKNGVSAEIALDRQIAQMGTDMREVALAAKLTFGVIQNRALLDFYLGAFCHTPLGELAPRVLDILRTAAYQMVFLDRIPVRAAVDEAVELTKVKDSRAAGLVNAVLRRFSERLSDLPEVPEDDPIAYLATRYSHPCWLVRRFVDELGFEGTAGLLAANNREVPLYAQVNTLKADVVQVLESLAAEGVCAERHPWLSDCVTITGAGSPTRLAAFREGFLYIQDPAARLALLALAVQPGMRVLDPCAAPGGKSFAAAIQMGNTGEIVSRDIGAKKIAHIQAGALRLGLEILQVEHGDARALDPAVHGMFDAVIVDAPCSGLGIIRKKPEIRNKMPQEIVRLPEIQLEILHAAARCVVRGGVLLYATCTVLSEENRGVVQAFLEETADFALEQFTLPGEIGLVEEGQITLYPHIHDTDGFFFCKLRRVK